MRMNAKRGAVAALVAIGGAFALTAASCNDDTPAAQGHEQQTQQSNFDYQQGHQPGVMMPYSPTRADINFFAQTWGHDPNKLSYVYLLNMNGDVIGYYVLRGLPVSYCASLYQPQKPDQFGNNGDAVLVPQPSVDGVYYAGSGPCNQYYGRDANTNGYVEWTAGTGISPLVTDRPMGRPDTDKRNLGPTVIGTERK